MLNPSDPDTDQKERDIFFLQKKSVFLKNALVFSRMTKYLEIKYSHF